MKKLDWYIIRKFLGTFFYALALIILIVIIFDISEKIDDFIEKKAPLNVIIFDYYVNFIPYFVNMFSALFTFIAVVYFTSRMASNTEIVAILGSGISFYRMLRPYMIAVTVIAALNLYLSNDVIPRVNKKRLEFEGKYIWPKGFEANINVHMQHNDSTYYFAESFDRYEGKANRLIIETIDKEHGLISKITARNAQYDSVSQTWLLKDVIERRVDSVREIYTRLPEKTMDLGIEPKDFETTFQNTEVMTFGDLNRVIAKEQAKGSPLARLYMYERMQRIAQPFAVFILTLIAVALSSRKVRGGTGLHIAIGLALAFLFIFFLQMTKMFATLGTFPIWLAAWLPIILFSLLSIYLIRIAPK